MMRKDIRVKPGRAQSAIGMIVGIVFVLIGLCFVIPQMGLFGILWTLIAVAITVINAINVFSEKGVATSRIEVDEWKRETSSSSVEERLKKAEDLYQKGMITKEEYDQKRKDILNDI